MNNSIVLIKRITDLAGNPAAYAATMPDSCPAQGLSGGRSHLVQDACPAVSHAFRSSLSFVLHRSSYIKEVVLHFPL